MKIVILIATLAAMFVFAQLPADTVQKPTTQPTQSWTQPVQHTQPAQPPREYYNGYEVVRWVDPYNVILRINGEEVGVSIQPEPSNWDPIVHWDAFDAIG